MTSYSTNGALDSHWQTPPPDPTNFLDQNRGSYDDQLLDIFAAEPFPPYSTNVQGGGQDVYGGSNSRIASGGTYDGSTYSESASSPQGSLSYASSTGYTTGNTSFGGTGTGMDFDLNSIFTAPSGSGSIGGDSPPFDFGGSLVCDFDTSGLQGIFPNQQQARISQLPFQGLSPPSNTTSPPQTLPHTSNYHPQLHSNPSLPRYPSQYLAPNQAAQSVGQSYPTPSRNPSISSGASPSSLPPGSYLDQDFATSKRRRVTLAETAGLVAQSQPQHSSSYAPTAFAVKPDTYQQLSSNPSIQSRTVQQAVTERKVKARSPVELIANAGISNVNVYNPPTYQLLPKPVNVASSTAQGKGKRIASSTFSLGNEDKSAAGGKRKKAAERGHNAVEQKYRNSINNALATLRDTIPALRHLKPLPSMPVSKRKASQFTLPSSVATVAPQGLVDGVTPAKTLSKGVILNKAIEYIDYLRFARESHNEDLEMLKEMVKTMVGGGEQLVAEFEKRRDEREAERVKERENEREEGEGDDEGSGDGEVDEEEEDEKTEPTVPKGKKAAAPKKRGAPTKKDASPPVKTKSMVANDMRGSTVSLPSQQISPPLTSEYRHIQALNAAHLESITASHPAATHTFPPSPVSSDDHSVSPAALVVDPAQYQSYGAQPPRVLLASFMGLSFAGGIGYDWSTATATAEEASAVVGSAWTSRLARRSLVSASQGPLFDSVHPSLLTGLVALGLASIIVSLVCVVYPLLKSPASSPPRSDSRRSRALSSLAASVPTSSSSTYSISKVNALDARKDLPNLVNAPSSLSLVFHLVAEAITWFFASQVGLSWSTKEGAIPSEENVEKAVAWIRIAEIEATVGSELSHLSRLYTFLHLSNFSRSPSWPQVTASTSLPAVSALLSTHLLSRGHVRWAQSLWSTVSSQRKRNDSVNPSDSFVEVALDADFETVRLLLDPTLSPERSDDDFAAPHDTVPLLRIADAACCDALEDVWNKIFTSVVDSTCPPHTATAIPSKEKLRLLTKNGDLEETVDVVLKSSVEGSEVRSLAVMTRAILDTFSVPEEEEDSADKSRIIAKACINTLLTEAKQGGPFSRFASAAPLCRLLLPSLPTDLVASFPPLHSALNAVDHLAATTLAWLVLRRENLDLLSDRSAYPSPPPSPTSTPSPLFDKVNLKVHSQALAVRQLLADNVFRNLETSTVEDGSIDLDEAKDLLVDALTSLARRAAGLGSRDDDSGVEL
ncbi:basic helix-loop-helix domain-containing protein [Sporobolomyces salmoneus]|uniref:basic helix-loop-helix domain-containing protein n=1 Tax=Sporobolomyces salmoneus TaxID=183962 RepID=UPI0031779669